MHVPRRLHCLLAVAGLLACNDDPTDAVFTPSGPCDSGLAFDAASATDAARAMGICDGLVSAAWVEPDGTVATVGGSFDLGHGILPSFGASNTPHEGAALLAISSGTARGTADPGYTADLDKGYSITPPAGFPENQATCPVPSSSGHDGIGLAVTLVVPPGVHSMTYDYSFFTRDYPDWDCTTSVDQAAALMTGIGGGTAVQNVLVDSSGNPMLASPTALRACTPSTGYTCSLGTAPLTGTGMTGSSGWITSGLLPVTPGDTIEAVFTIWDSFDGNVDSSLLLDDFSWIP